MKWRKEDYRYLGTSENYSASVWKNIFCVGFSFHVWLKPDCVGEIRNGYKTLASAKRGAERMIKRLEGKS